MRKSQALRKSSKKPRQSLLASLALILSCALIGYAAFGFWQRYRATHRLPASTSSEVVTASTTTPDETAPTETCDEYAAADVRPKKIQISKVDIDGCVQRVGIDQYNAVAVPTNVHVAGWYVDSPLPGDEGVSLVDGHIVGRYSDAIFGRLHQLETGDVVRVVAGDNSVRVFEVVEVVSYPEGDATRELFKPLDGVDRQLTLITCGGRYDNASQAYDERLIVRTKLVLGND